MELTDVIKLGSKRYVRLTLVCQHSGVSRYGVFRYCRDKKIAIIPVNAASVVDKKKSSVYYVRIGQRLNRFFALSQSTVNTRWASVDEYDCLGHDMDDVLKFYNKYYFLNVHRVGRYIDTYSLGLIVRKRPSTLRNKIRRGILTQHTYLKNFVKLDLRLKLFLNFYSFGHRNVYLTTYYLRQRSYVLYSLVRSKGYDKCITLEEFLRVKEYKMKKVSRLTMKLCKNTSMTEECKKRLLYYVGQWGCNNIKNSSRFGSKPKTMTSFTLQKSTNDSLRAKESDVKVSSLISEDEKTYQQAV